MLKQIQIGFILSDYSIPLTVQLTASYSANGAVEEQTGKAKHLEKEVKKGSSMIPYVMVSLAYRTCEMFNYTLIMKDFLTLS